MPIIQPPIIQPPIPEPSMGPLTCGSRNSNIPALAAENTATAGVAVSGDSPNGIAISGQSLTQVGVKGSSSLFDAVVGETQSDGHAGVTGRNLTTGTNGGVGIYGTGGKFAGKFDGDLQVNGNANITGTLYATVDVVLGSDCAEDFDISPSTGIEAGTVMVLSEDGSLRASQNPYDKKVAGVISGAGDYKPGLILGRSHPSSNRMPLALAGKVYCKVDARHAAIEIGDLLTTSGTIGHAMKADDPTKAFGAVIGKSLRRVSTGQKDLIPILVALQ